MFCFKIHLHLTKTKSIVWLLNIIDRWYTEVGLQFSLPWSLEETGTKQETPRVFFLLKISLVFRRVDRTLSINLWNKFLLIWLCLWCSSPASVECTIGLNFTNEGIKRFFLRHTSTNVIVFKKICCPGWFVTVLNCFMYSVVTQSMCMCTFRPENVKRLLLAIESVVIIKIQHKSDICAVPTTSV